MAVLLLFSPLSHLLTTPSISSDQNPVQYIKPHRPLPKQAIQRPSSIQQRPLPPLGDLGESPRLDTRLLLVGLDGFGAVDCSNVDQGVEVSSRSTV